MIDDEREEFAALYSLGLLSEEDAAHFENEMRGDPELQVAVREFQDSTAALAWHAPKQLPPSRVRMALFAKVRRDAAAHAPARGADPRILWALAAAIALFATLLGVVAIDRAHLRDQLQAKEGEYGAARNEFASLSSQNRDLQKQLALLMDQDQNLQKEIAELKGGDALAKVRIATLTSTAPSSKAPAVGVVAWSDGQQHDAQQHGIVTLEKLPPPGPAEDYQLWLIDPKLKQPVSGGVVHIDEKGEGRLRFTVEIPIHAGDSFAVSREPGGGSASPKGPIILSGQIGG